MSVSSAFFMKFKKVISLVGSNREGERHAAADQAFRMCDENDLSVLEALDGAFGNDAGADELRRQIEELEDDNRKLAEAVELLNARQHVIPDNAGKELLQRLWSYPEVRLLWTVFTASGFLWAIPAMVEVFPGFLPFRAWEHLFDWIFGLGSLLWFKDWAVAEFSRRGVGSVVMKGILVVTGVVIGVLGFHDRPDVGLYVLIWTALIGVTNAMPGLLDKLQHSESWLFEGIRSWFV